MVCFQQLCNALQDVFFACTHQEDELNYSSATLLLAGLLQVHSRIPRFASHSARLASFSDSRTIQSDGGQAVSPEEKLFPSPEELASAGFFSTGRGDETICTACGLGLRDWQANDQPEDCHLAYSTAQIQLLSSSELSCRLTPALPCLYLTARRFLTSELPLTRKSLVPVGPSKPISSLSGIITPPLLGSSASRSYEDTVQFASLADRLRAVVRIMASPPSPQGWPIENARALGHSDDLIVLALWCLQAQSTTPSLACPPLSALHLDPQATTDLLRTILLLQELFDESPMSASNVEYDKLFIDDSDYDLELTMEDTETAAFSECGVRRVRTWTKSVEQLADSPSPSTNRIRLPRFHQFITWWDLKWPTNESGA